MEFRCSHCQHVGEASAVRPSGDGVVLVCANCGHENALDVGGGDAGASVEAAEEDEDRKTLEDRDEDLTVEPADVEVARPAQPDPDTPAVKTTSVEASMAAAAAELDDEVVQRARKAKVDREWLRDNALERLIPASGEGPRCPKCAHLVVEDDVYCGRCGLALEEGRSYASGEAPWETPPPGNEAEWEQAHLLWEAFEEDRTPDNLDKFVDFIAEVDLPELGVRHLRFHLAEHPDDEHAVDHLREIAGTFQARIIVARARAEMNAEQFNDATRRAKTWLIWANVVFWSGLLVFFLVLFFNRG